ncbi:RNA 2',3'-cyclic phosphodiesterase [Sneathiella glossodoripedis]|uniref:RNA 2',3'-cyclic phosphodiesterase n=1 Tax=Sneathiella glossodoripedis TaxID=418853 RepID=UPI000689065E|nr:RNA 2',3'-cyclic phosphodiesterase [Sneathiella glossodoripedis]
MRLFVAIDLPEDFKQQIAALQSGIPDAYWSKPENAHITLNFLGEINQADMLDIGLALGKIKAPSFSFSLDSVGIFGNSKRPRILWAGIRSTPELVALQQKTTNVLSRCGIKLEERRFRPHVTLARIHNSPYERVRSYLTDHALFKSRSVQSTCFTLYSSRLGHGGPHYEEEFTFDLEATHVAADLQES